MNASFQDNVILPCYAHTEKDIADDAVNILWTKEYQTPKKVAEVINGNASSGSGFKRASLSPNHYRDGDLSLSVSKVTPSDNGLYLCYHGQTGEYGYPKAVTLTVTGSRMFFSTVGFPNEKNTFD